MDDLKFNIYALVDPQTPEDLAALLDEAVRVFEELDESMAMLEAKLAARGGPRSQALGFHSRRSSP